MEAQSQSVLHGLTLAQGAPTLTHGMYADDLVLFGKIEERKIQVLKRIMEEFGILSGLQINNEKLVIWFSKSITRRERGMVTQAFPAKELDDSTTYLGYPLPKGKVTSRHYNTMENKIMGKFVGWKLHTLSPVGRLILAKHVLFALPVYYMGTHLLPKVTLNKLVSRTRRFFWGKQQ
jgi:Reverse transcriptase (RNA-dependent DNA polymerase)